MLSGRSVMFRRWMATGLSAIAILVLMSGAFVSLRPGPAQALPAQFTDTTVASVPSPTAIAFLPDGRMLVTTQGGSVRVIINGTLQAGSALNLSARLCSDFERGLLGIAVDPSFATNGYVYLYYTFNKHDTCVDNSIYSPVNRVSRFTMSGNTISASSETILIDNIHSPNGNHNAGDLKFGKDGYLYVAVGDGGCDLYGAGCAGNNQNARKEHLLTGKILRITRDGLIPASNPYTDPATSARCNVTGQTTPGKRCRETWAWGLRNPFRMAVDPNSASTRLYINDVGQNVWEEVDHGVAGSDYGWNIREGFCANGSPAPCDANPSGLRAPIHAYSHDNGCASITGGAFVPNGIWPAAHDNTYLYADYVCGRIYGMPVGGGTATLFSSGVGSITVLQFGPDGDGTALYYANYSGGGQIRKIAFTGLANRLPIASISASPLSGALPLPVAFSAAATTDPDGDALTFDWDFGDGTPHSTVRNPSHTYTVAGSYTARMTVTDSRGASASADLTIDAGNTAPDATIDAPLPEDTFAAGETITLSATAIDEQEGILPDESLEWDVVLHHGKHTHPFQSGLVGNDLTFVAPVPEDLLAATNSYLEIILTATDSTGLATTVSQDLLPAKVNVNLNTSPSSRILKVNGASIVGGSTIVSWEGYGLAVSASDQVDAYGQPIVFSAWSDAGARSHTVTTPSAQATLTAAFIASNAASFVPDRDTRVEQANPGSNFGTSGLLRARDSATSDSAPYLRFNVAGLAGPVTRATLWLYASDGTANGPDISAAATTWGETSVTWTSRPATLGAPVDDRGAIVTGRWVSYDVTDLVTGTGRFAFVLTGQSADTVTFPSRESATKWPRLVVETGTTPDAQAPTTPGAPSASVGAGITISWTASTDNNAVIGYDIRRDGRVYITIRNTTSFTDTAVAPGQSATYAVRSRDAAGNLSAWSATVTETGPYQSVTKTYGATADSRINSGAAITNFGTSTQLQVRGPGEPTIESYLKFSVSGLTGPVSRATLRLVVGSTASAGSTDGPAVYLGVSSWTESGLTWANRPGRGTIAAADLGGIAPGTVVELDVTSFITGNGTVTLVLVGTWTDIAVFSSREGTAGPKLIVVSSVGPASVARVSMSPATVTDAASMDPAPTATATPTPADPAPTATATPTAAVTEAAASPVATGVAPTQAADASPTWTPFAASFDEGVIGPWTVSGALPLSGPGAGGSVAAVTLDAGDPEAQSGLAWTLPVLPTELHVSFAIQQTGLLGSPARVAAIADANGRPIFSVVLSPDGVLSLLNEQTGRDVPIGSIADGQWHEVQMAVGTGGDRLHMTVWLDDLVAYDGTQRIGTELVAGVWFGMRSAAPGGGIRLDTITVDDQCAGTCSTDRVPTATAAIAPTPVPAAVVGSPVAADPTVPIS